MLLGPPPRHIEGVAQHPVDALARENALLHGHLFVRVPIEAAADLGIFALGVLAHAKEVDVARLAAGQRRRHSGEQPHRAQVDVLAEAAPDGDQKPPQRDVVGNLGPADGAEEDGVEGPQLLEAVFRHHAPALQEPFAAPVELGPLEGDIEAPPHGLQHG